MKQAIVFAALAIALGASVSPALAKGGKGKSHRFDAAHITMPVVIAKGGKGKSHRIDRDAEAMA